MINNGCIRRTAHITYIDIPLPEQLHGLLAFLLPTALRIETFERGIDTNTIDITIICCSNVVEFTF